MERKVGNILFFVFFFVFDSCCSIVISFDFDISDPKQDVVKFFVYDYDKYR